MTTPQRTEGEGKQATHTLTRELPIFHQFSSVYFVLLNRSCDQQQAPPYFDQQ
jgi:hypothetical protein